MIPETAASLTQMVTQDWCVQKRGVGVKQGFEQGGKRLIPLCKWGKKPSWPSLGFCFDPPGLVEHDGAVAGKDDSTLVVTVEETLSKRRNDK